MDKLMLSDLYTVNASYPLDSIHISLKSGSDDLKHNLVRYNSSFPNLCNNKGPKIT